ncbi:MAG TPA: hypothetical protein VFQ44_15520 [Streptosporangiaceae bacterium]|nr:hypothetical protein [Streptosporangiaceae bacterium]
MLMLKGDAASGETAGPSGKRPVSLLVESLAYLGALFVLAGSAVATQQRWLHLTNLERVAVLAVAAAILLIAGFVVRWATSSGAERITETLWLASVACLAGAVAVATGGVYAQSADVTALAVSALVAIYSCALWFACRREVLIVTTFAGLVGGSCSGLAVGWSDATPWFTIALGLWLLGLAWVLVGWLYPEPLGTSVTAGASIALMAPAIVVHDASWAYLIGMATAAVIIAASLPMREVVMLAFGSCALFGYITAATLLFSNTLGIADTLMVIGGTLIGLAALTVRLSRATRRAGTGIDSTRRSAQPRPDRPAGGGQAEHKRAA